MQNFLRVFYQTLAHENSKKKTRQRHGGRRYGEKSEYRRDYSEHEKNNCSSGLPSPLGGFSRKQYMNYLTTIAYTYNPSTEPWEDATKKTSFNILYTFSNCS